MIFRDPPSRIGRPLLRQALLAAAAVLTMASPASAQVDEYRAGQSLPPALRGAYVLLNGQPSGGFLGGIFGGQATVASIRYSTGRAPSSRPQVQLYYGVKLTHSHPSTDPGTAAQDRTHEISISVTWHASREAADADMASMSGVPYGSFGERSMTGARTRVLPGAGGFWVYAQRGTLVVSWSAGAFACARDRQYGGWTGVSGDGGATPPQDVFGLELLPAILARAPDLDVAAVVAAKQRRSPVTPGAAAAAGAATALVTTLGALWMLGASGLRPSDLLGALPPATDAPAPLDDPSLLDVPEPADIPSASSPPATALAAIPRDGEVRPTTGEVWSDANGGWVGENLYRQEQAWQREIERAQAVSRDESRRGSAEMAEAWRRSRQARDAAAERAADLGRQAEEIAALEPVRIQEYQPGWADRIETGLEWMQWGADESLGILEKLTGPAGESVSKAYSLAKGTAGGASQGVAQWLRSEDANASLAWAVAKGGGIGAAEVVQGMVIDELVGKVSGVLQPGLGLDQIALPEIELGGDSAGSVAQRLLDPDDPLAGGILKTMGVSHASGVLDDEIRGPIESAVKAVTGEEE